MKKVISKTLLAGSMFLLTVTTPMQKNSHSLRTIDLDFIKARAKTTLSATANLTTTQGVSNFIRYNYYAFNGAAGDYEIEQGLGFLEVLNNVLGSDGMGGVLGAKGYAECSSIPTSGSSSGTVSGGGQTMTINFTFGAGIRKVPAHFPHDAGSTYDKSITINTMMGKYYIEMKCSSGGVSTAYIYSVNNMGSGETINEAFYQKDGAAVYVDFYLQSASPNVIDVNRFVTEDGSKFSIYHFAVNKSSNGGSAFAITGEANKKANINAVVLSNMSGDVAPKPIFSDLSGSATGGGQTIVSSCIDMSTNSSASGCYSLEAADDLEIGTSTYDWSFDTMKNFTTSPSPF